MNSYSDVKLFIDGNWRDALAGETIGIVDPATEEVIGNVAHARAADLDLALAAADKGFRQWSNMAAFDRAAIMRKAARILHDRLDAIAYVLTREQGKPLTQARNEIQAAVEIIDYFSEEATRTFGQIIPAREANVMQMVLKVPVGPVAVFTPWNFPIYQVVLKLSAALAAGCSIIVKAPEETPASPAELIRAFADAGIPEGVINLVFGTPADISHYLTTSPIIRKISFTGSTPVGKQLAALAGAHMKKSTMELGGHAPVMIFNDADIERAIAVTASAKYYNAGQICIAATRFMVQDDVADRFIEGFVNAAGKYTVGNGLDAETKMGPLANERRIPALEKMIQDGVSRGGKLLTGGKRIGNKGYFFEPTVIADVPVEASMMNDEPFGPLAIINRFSKVDEAIAEANRLPFGLAAYAFTRSMETAHTLSRRVESGMLTINHHGLALPETPFGGIKDSGYGTEGGAEATSAYMETRFVTQMV